LLLALSQDARRNVAKAIIKSATRVQTKKYENMLIVLQTLHAGTIIYMVIDEVEARKNEPSSMSLSPVGSLANLSLSSANVWENDRIFIPGTRRLHSLDHYKKHLGEKYDSLCTVTRCHLPSWLSYCKWSIDTPPIINC
jgi:hypothetical protein